MNPWHFSLPPERDTLIDLTEAEMNASELAEWDQMKTQTESVLTKNQKRTYGPRFIAGWGHGAQITATVRYDDECGNGHNRFAITAEIVTPASKRRNDVEACGCLHDEIARVFPELAPFIKWHLCSSDGPIHYVANTVYHAQNGQLDYARSSAVWPEATDEELTAPDLAERLQERLPALLESFQEAVESLGFTY